MQAQCLGLKHEASPVVLENLRHLEKEKLKGLEHKGD